MKILGFFIGSLQRPRATIPLMRSPLRLLELLAFTCLVTVWASAEPLPQKPAELFQETKVWTVHLTFTPEQWETMEPKGGGMRGGGGMRMGLSMILAPTFIKDGDQDHDGKLSAK